MCRRRVQLLVAATAALGALAPGRTAGGAIVECPEERDWVVQSRGSALEREAAAQLVVAALQLTGAKVLKTDVRAFDRSRASGVCMGVVQLGVERVGNEVAVELRRVAAAGYAAGRGDAVGEDIVTGRSRAPSVISAVEEALSQVGLARPGTPLVALAPPPACPPARSGELRALLVGIDSYDPPFTRLRGSRRDAMLFERFLGDRLPAAKVRTVVDVGILELRRALTTLVEETSCGDRVLFHFSGAGMVGASGSTGPGEPEVHRGAKVLPDLGADHVALVAVDGKALGEGDLRGFVTALRNRGAQVVVHLDACFARAFRLGVFWRWPKDVELLPGAGGYALLAAGDVALELRGEQGEFAGLFTTATLAALAAEESPTVRRLAAAVSAQMAAKVSGEKSGQPFFEASDPDAPLLGATASAVALGVELEGEKGVRGGTPLKPPGPGQKVTLRGRIKPHQDLWALMVNGLATPVDATGAFTVELALAPGAHTILFVAFYRNLSTASGTREVRVGGEADTPAGRRYALVIGIENYDHWTKLTTPLADVRDIERVLRERYGFVTELEAFGSLVLRDATKLQIGNALSALRRALRPEDSLLVYFAGHGQAVGERRRGFWIPRDAATENRATWYSGGELMGEIADIQARHVLVISDSCFSGDLTRDQPIPAKDLSPAERREYMAKASSRRSRVIISSGFDEPVLDRGGHGHSVFAEALLAGLDGMSGDRFLAQELYSEYLYPRVAGKSPQAPSRQIIADSGHEGGEMVFVKTPRP